MNGCAYTEEEFKQKCEYYNVPEHDIDGLWLYMTEGIEPGFFLEAVLSNNLKESFARADWINQASLYNCFPSVAWGSEEKFNNWIKSFKTEESQSGRND